jgi:hypothetical protein
MKRNSKFIGRIILFVFFISLFFEVSGAHALSVLVRQTQRPGYGYNEDKWENMTQAIQLQYCHTSLQMEWIRFSLLWQE